MIAGNRRAGMFVLAFVLALFCLSLLTVLRPHWKTRKPVPQTPITGAFHPEARPSIWSCAAEIEESERMN